VILWQLINSKTILPRHNGSAVTNICNIALCLNSQNNDCARARLVNLWILHGQLKEPFLSYATAVPERFPRIFWEAILSDDDLVKMILQKISAVTSAMAIINCKKGALWPRGRILIWWPCHIQNNWHTVLVVVSLNTLMRICRVACDQAMGLRGIFRLLKILQRIVKYVLITIVTTSKTSEEIAALNETLQLCFNNVKNRIVSILKIYVLLLAFSLNFQYNFAKITRFVG